MIQFIPTTLAWEVMQLHPSLRLPSNDYKTFCMCMGHNHNSSGVEGQGHRSKFQMQSASNKRCHISTAPFDSMQNLDIERRVKGKRKHIAVCAGNAAPLWETACHMGSGPAKAASPAPNPAVTDSLYSIFPPIKDERLSRPEPVQVNDLPRAATEVPATPCASWLNRHSAH